MLPRLLLAVLVVANLGYFLWSRATAGDAAEREPQRMTQQIRPELLQVRPTPLATAPAGIGASTAPPSTPTPTPAR